MSILRVGGLKLITKTQKDNINLDGIPTKNKQKNTHPLL